MSVTGTITPNAASYTEQQSGAYYVFSGALLDASTVVDFSNRIVTLSITDARAGDDLSLVSGTTTPGGALITIVGVNVFVQMPGDTAPGAFFGTIADSGTTISFNMQSGIASDARMNEVLKAIRFSSTSDDPTGNLSNANDTQRSYALTVTVPGGTTFEPSFAGDTGTFTITPVNDVITSSTADAVLTAVTENSATGDTTTIARTATGTINFTDVDFLDAGNDDKLDTTDKPTIALKIIEGTTDVTTSYSAAATALLTKLALTDTGINAVGAGFVDWKVEFSQADIDFIPAGKTLKLEYSVTISGGGGAGDSITKKISVDVTGTNDTPTGQNNTIALTEPTAAPGIATYTLKLADFGFNDADAGDTFAALRIDSLPAAADGVLELNGTPVTLPAEITIADIDANKLVFKAADKATGTSTVTFDFSVKDSAGAYDAASNTITFSVTNVNDAPTVAAALTDTKSEGDASYTLNLLSGAADVDGGALSVTGVTYAVDGGSASSTAPAGFSLSGATLSVDPTDVAFNSLGVGQSRIVVVSYTISDGNGGTVPQTMTVTINGTNDGPTAVADIYGGPAVVEVGVGVTSTVEATGNVLTNDTDPDNGDTKVVDTSVITGPAGPGAQSGEFSINGAYGWLYIKADGSYRYVLDNARTATQQLTAGSDGSETFNYTMKDGSGATSSSTLKIDITGTADAPVITSGATVNSVDEITASLGSAANVLDVDATDVDSSSLTYSLDNDAGGRFQINSISGVVTVKSGVNPLLFDNEQNATHTIVVRVSDGVNAVTQSYTVNVTDINPETVVLNGAGIKVVGGDDNDSFTYSVGASAPAGVDEVDGTKSTATDSDTLTVNFTAGANGTSAAPITVTNGAGSDAGKILIDVDGNGTADIKAQDVEKIILNLDDGSDVVRISDSAYATIDKIDGGAGGDTLVVATGNVLNLGADDRLDGVETIELTGASGVDASGQTEDLNIVGSSSTNTIISGSGDDTLTGGDGNDTLNGGAGDDSIVGGAGIDAISGGDGADKITDNWSGTWTPNNRINGDGGNDDITVTADAGGSTETVNVNNWVRGGDGADKITFNFDGTQISGNFSIAGDQETSDQPGTAAGGTPPTQGWNTVGAADGNDEITINGSFSVAPGSQARVLLNGGDDKFINNATSGAIRVYGGGGKDSIVGGAASETMLNGGAGDDTIDGRGGDDSLYGEDGNDSLTGGAGVDRVFGGAGDDTIVWKSGDGNDSIDGGADTDTLQVTATNAAESLTLSGSTLSGGLLGSLNVTNVERYELDMLGGNDTVEVSASPSGITMRIDGGEDGTDNNTTTDADQLIVNLTSSADGTSPAPVTISVDTMGTTSTADDRVLINTNGAGAPEISAKNFEKITINADDGDDVITVAGDFVSAGVSPNTIIVNLGGGNDTFNATGSNVSLDVRGDAGNDDIKGGDLADILQGGADNDTFRDGKGDDVIYGGTTAGDDLSPTIDEAVYSGTAIVSWNSTLGAWQVEDTTAGTGKDTLYGIEKLTIGTQSYWLVDGTTTGGFQTLQEAVNAANPSGGDTILVAPVTLTAATTIDRAVTILGLNNAGIDPIGGAGTNALTGGTTRGAESVITGTLTVAIASGTVTIDGLNVLNTTNNATQHDGIVTTGAGALTVTNTIFSSTQANGGGSYPGDVAIRIANSAGDVTIDNNLFRADFSGPGKYSTAAWHVGIYTENDTRTLTVTDNSLNNLRVGMGLGGLSAADVIDRNLIKNAGSGISAGGSLDMGALGSGADKNTFEGVDTEFNLRSASAGFTFDSSTQNFATNSAADPNVILGGDFDDTITGTSGADSIAGDASNPNDGGISFGAASANGDKNRLSGLAGNDTILGSTGDDTIDGGADDDQLAGGGGKDDIRGGAGADVLQGGAGNDTLRGGAGADSISGGDDSDSIFVEAIPDYTDGTGDTIDGGSGGVNDDYLAINIAGGPSQLALGADGRVTNVENIQLYGNSGVDASQQTENLYIFGDTGSPGANNIIGGSGNDKIEGRAGDDTIDGGGGNDTIVYASGDGNDTVDGNAGTDALEVSGTSGADSVQISATSVGIGGGTITVSNVETITVNTGGDADSAAVNAYVTGATSITVDGDAGIDTLDFSGSTGATGVTANLGTGAVTGLDGQGANGFTASNFENVTGSSKADVLTGSLGNNIIIGGDGDDAITGGGGNDDIQGGAGTGDKAIYADNRAGYTIGTTSSSGFVTSFDSVKEKSPVTGTDEGTDTLTGVEILEFNDLTLNLNQPVQLFNASGALVGTFTTIQAAVDAASDGEKILVNEDTYNVAPYALSGTEDVNVTKAVTIESVNGDAVVGSFVVQPGALDGATDIVTIRGFDVVASGPESVGIVVSSNYTASLLGTLNVDKTDVSGFSFAGLSVTGGGKDLNVNVTTSTFANNGGLTASNGNSDVLFFAFLGDALLKDVTVSNNRSLTIGQRADTAIQIAGFDPGDYDVSQPIGSVVFDNVTVNGQFDKVAVYVQGYTDLSGLKFGTATTNGVSGSVSAGWGYGTYVNPTADTLTTNAPDVAGQPGAFVAAAPDGSVDLSKVTMTNSGVINVGSGHPLFPYNGTALQAIINGTPGDDVIVGTPGDDLISGLGGTDSLNGGGGNDRYVVFPAAGTVNIDDTGASGTDRLRIQGTGGNDGFVFADADTITLNGTTTVNIDGVEEVTVDAKLLGGATDGAAVDTLNFSALSAAVQVNLSNQAAQTIAGGGLEAATYTAIDFENVTGTGFSDTITGSAEANTIIGADGDDTVMGGAGEDILIGGAGADSLSGEAGNDIFRIDLATDYIGGDFIDGGDNADIIEINTSTQLALGPNADVVNVETINLTGTSGVNASTQEEGFTINGSSGANVIRGGQGADSVLAGAGADTINYASGNGNDAIDGGADGDTLNVTGTTDADTIKVNGGTIDVNANTLTVTNTETVSITTGAGNDTVEGNAYLVGATSITVNGEGNTDLLTFANSATAINANIGSGVVTGMSGQGGTFTANNFENLTGSALSDTLTGSSVANVIIGGDGNDTIDGADGDDVITGGAGVDSMRGGDGSDTFIIGSASDYAPGENIQGNVGNNPSQPVSGASPAAKGDAIQFTGTGAFTLQDDSLVGGVETIDLTSTTGGVNLNASSQSEGFLILGTGQSDTVVGGSGSDSILSGAGDDVITYGVRNGNDTIDGGIGSDTLTVNGDGDQNTASVNATTVVITDPNPSPSVTNMLTVENGSVETLNVNLSGLSDTMNMNALLTGATNINLSGGTNGGIGDTLNLAGLSTATNGVSTTLGSGFNAVTGGNIGSSVSLRQREFENATGGAGADTLTGDVQDNLLIGAGGADILSGAGGNDTLDGGAGNDVLTGGAGSDSILGGNDNDTIVINGGEYVNSITGDYIDGGSGTDTIEINTGGVLTLNNQSIPVFAPTLGDDFVVGVENINLLGTSGVDASSQSEGFTITGSSSANRVIGAQGNDTILLGGGNDTVNGNTGDDSITGGGGNDSIYGGAGNDTAVYFGDWADYDIYFDPISGEVTIRDERSGSPDGTDQVLIIGADKVENFQFADGTLTASQLLNRAPVLSPSATATTLDENVGQTTAPAWSFDAKALLTDPNGVRPSPTATGVYDTHRFSLANDAGGRFEIHPTTGVVTLAAWALVNFEANESHTFTVKVEDAGGLFDVETYTVQVNNLNDKPVVVNDTGTQGENETKTYAVLANDSAVESGQTLSISALTYTGPGTATIDGNAIKFATGSAFDSLKAGETAVVTIGYTAKDVTGTSLVAGGAETTGTLTLTIVGANDAPKFTSVIAGSTDEDATSSVTLNLLDTVSDAEGDATSVQSLVVTASTGQVVSYSVSGGQITINPAQFNALKGNETATVTMTYLVTDGTASVTRTAILTVEGRDDDPTATTGTISLGATEDDAFVFTLPAGVFADADGDALSYSLASGAPSGLTIDPVTGVLSWTPTDAQVGTNTFTVLASDGAGTRAEKTVTITVANSNDAPVITGVTLAAAPGQNASAGAAVATVMATDDDSDSGDVLTYSVVGGNEAGLFTISNTGAITLTGTPGQGNVGQHQLTVAVRDAAGAVATVGVTATIVDVNDEPTAIIVTDALTVIAENTAARTKIATISVADIDTAAPFLANTVTVNDDRFEIVGNELFLKAGQVIDREASGGGSITLTLTTGPSSSPVTSTVTIAVADVNDNAPVVALTPNATTVAENNAAVAVATIATTDADATAAVNGAVVYSLAGADAARFEILDGKLVFKAGADFEGASSNGDDVYEVTVTATDGGNAALTSSAAFTVTVTDVNELPVITSLPQVGAVIEDGQAGAETTATGRFTAVDPDGTTPQWQVKTGSSSWTTITGDTSFENNYGTFVVRADGSWSFTLDNTKTDTNALGAEGNLLGQTGLVVRAFDGTNASGEQSLGIAIAGTNDAPRISGVVTAAAVDEDGLTTIDVLGAGTPWSDPEGKPLSLVSAEAANGTVSISGGNLIYRPNADWSGTETITYAVTDGDRVSTSTVTITVTPVNDAPVVTSLPQVGAVIEDGAAAPSAETVTGGQLTASDVDAGQTIGWQYFDAATSGWVTVSGTATIANNYGVFTLSASGAWTFTLDNSKPDTNALGAEGNLLGQTGLQVRAVDSGSSPLTSAATTILVGIAGTNDAPALTGAAVVVSGATEDTAVTNIAVLTGWTDAESKPLSVVSASAANGDVSINADGTLNYTPAADWNGTETITYAVTDGDRVTTASISFTVGAVNDAPVAADDVAAAIAVENGAAVTGNVLGNDSDVETVALTASLVSPGTGAHGTLTLNGDGSFSYVATNNGLKAGETAVETFTYKVTDAGGATDTATLTINVIGTNDAPVFTAVFPSQTTAEDTALTMTIPPIGLIATDADGDTLVLSAVIRDASGATIASYPVVTPGGTVSFVPPRDFNGTLTATFIVDDQQGGRASQDVMITVTPVNDAPVVTSLPQVGAVIEDGAAAPSAETVTGGQLTASDVDAGQTIGWQYFDAATSGWVTVSGTATIANNYGVFTLSASGAWTFTLDNSKPDTNALGAEGNLLGQTGLQVRAVDSGSSPLTSAATTILVGIAGTNDAPALTGAAVVVSGATEDTAVTNIAVLTGWTDAESKPLSVVSASAANGDVSINADGTLNYTPAADWNGTETITYAVTDGDRVTTASISFTVGAVNDAPVAADDVAAAIAVENGAAVTGNVLGNDSDVETVALTASLVSPGTGAHGTLTLNSDGSFSYVATNNGLKAGETAVETFTYKVTDAGGATDTATLTINVIGTNDAPVFTAVFPSQTTAEDTALTMTIPPIGLIATDADGDTLVLSAVIRDASGATIASYPVVTPGGTVSFVPPRDFNGTLTATFIVDDQQGGRASQDVMITVTPVNDAPVAADLYLGTTTEDAAITGTIDLDGLVQDVDGPSATFTLVGVTLEGVALTPAQLAGGWLSFDVGTGAYSFDPAAAPASLGLQQMNAGQSKTIAITYQVADGPSGADQGVISFDVTGANDVPSNITVTGPLAVAENIAGASFGEVGVEDVDNTTGFTFGVSDARFVVDTSGPAPMLKLKPGASLDFEEGAVVPVTVTVTDAGGLTKSRTFQVEVANVDEAPTATDDAGFTVAEDGMITIPFATLLANDSDPENGTLTITSVTGVNGTATIVGTDIKFVPAANYNGPASFTYTVSDGSNTDTATVSLMVTPVNDAPEAAASGNSVSGPEDTIITGSVPLGSDVETAAGALTYALVGSAPAGLVFNGNGTFQYTPAPNAAGSVTFEYRVVDAEGAVSAPKTFTINVMAVDDGVGTVSIAPVGTEVDILDTITATVTADPDGAGTLAYRWQQSVDGSDWLDIDGATTAAFQPTDEQVGLRLRVTVTTIDAQGFMSTLISNVSQPIWGEDALGNRWMNTFEEVDDAFIVRSQTWYDRGANDAWSTFTYVFNDDGQVVQQFGDLDDGNSWIQDYNGLEQVTSTTIIDGGAPDVWQSVLSVYNPSTGALTSQTVVYDDGNTLTTQYNAAGVPTDQDWADGGAQDWWTSIDVDFDSVGRKTKETFTADDGNVLENSFNASGQLFQQKWTDGGVNEWWTEATFIYNPSTGQKTSETYFGDDGNSVTALYNTSGVLTQQNWIDGGAEEWWETSQVTFNAAGQVTRQFYTMDDGNSIAYNYTDTVLVSQVLYDDNSDEWWQTYTIEYNAAGGIQRQVWLLDNGSTIIG